ncbi:MAG TPA: tetratricopeptide repeat protein [Bacteroidia bacterium]|nr:tetratricopeptide repeat protein [Bacteroidia bacterium]
MSAKRLIVYIIPAALVLSCSTKKNTTASRAFHNLTARYNGYYYSTLNMNEGIYKIERSYKENFDKVLPIYIYPTPAQAKANTAEFDKAIKKSSLCIQRHTIKDSKGNEITSAGKWIDNNWINIGIAHFYKREYYSAMEAFEYVVRSYPKSKDKYLAMVWLAKVNNEVGSVSTSESLIALLKNEKTLPKEVKKELPVLMADYYMRRGQNTEAVARLMEATANKKLIGGLSRTKRARYSFIIAQLLEQTKENKRAIRYYQATLKQKPSYDLVFYSKIHIARLMDVKRANTEKTKKDLLKMSKESKNSDYFDVIYFTLGEIEEKENKVDKAEYYYKRSVQTSVSNNSQKAQSFLKLGEINFERTNYVPAEAYYDSAVTALPKDHPDYADIMARKKTLSTLVGHIKTIQNEDSLQRIAKMSEIERNMFIDRLIAKLELEAAKKQKELEAAANNPPPGAGFGENIPPPMAFGNTGATFYFYNPATVAYGISDFTKKWGNRKLEDNWRRSNKALTIEENTEQVDTAQKKVAEVRDPAKMREPYLKDLPLNDSLLRRSDKKIIKAYYLLGSVYKEDLHNNKKATLTFEELNKRFPDNRYQVNTYYVMYRIALEEKNQTRADFYKDKIINEYPDSEFAFMLKNPDYAREMNVEKSELEQSYSAAYTAYRAEDYKGAYGLSNEAVIKYGKNDYLPKFLFIRAMSVGKLKGVDSLEKELKLLVGKYPNAEVTPMANDVLLAIKKQKNPDLFEPVKPGQSVSDTFLVNLEGEHFFILLAPDDPKIIDALKTKLNAFNAAYYGEKNFKITSSLFGNGKQLLVQKSYTDAKEAVNYYQNLLKDPDVFSGEVKKEMLEMYPIAAVNLPLLYKKKNHSAYALFYADNYKSLETNNPIQK